MKQRILGFAVATALTSCSASIPQSHQAKIESHLRGVIERGLDIYGPRKTALWLASIDIRSGGQFEPAPEASRRTYRTIHAPYGSTLYWDQPLVAVAFAATELTGDSRYANAADAYLREALACCVDQSTGMLEWGNHLYYDVFQDRTADIFDPVHEIRPITPAWEMLWRIDSDVIERAVEAAVEGHVYNAETGLFNRHALTGENQASAKSDQPMPFLAAGASLVESLAWLSTKRPLEAGALADKAASIARYSFDRRNPVTGLVPTQPYVPRWDSESATTETGLWARALLRTHRITGRAEFRDMASEALLAYATAGWDERAGRYYGRLRLIDATPEVERTTEWQPGPHSDVWEPLFPSHDYPMHFAEACLTLWEINGDERFAECARRWVRQIEGQMPPRYPAASITDTDLQPGTFAEFYGRTIHFLVRASTLLDAPQARPLAEQLAAEAIATLWVPEAGMFRSHPGVDRADAVDGLGYLFAALLRLETSQDSHLGGIEF